MLLCVFFFHGEPTRDLELCPVGSFLDFCCHTFIPLRCFTRTPNRGPRAIVPGLRPGAPAYLAAVLVGVLYDVADLVSIGGVGVGVVLPVFPSVDIRAGSLRDQTSFS